MDESLGRDWYVGPPHPDVAAKRGQEVGAKASLSLNGILLPLRQPLVSPRPFTRHHIYVNRCVFKAKSENKNTHNQIDGCIFRT